MLSINEIVQKYWQGNEHNHFLMVKDYKGHRPIYMKVFTPGFTQNQFQFVMHVHNNENLWLIYKENGYRLATVILDKNG